MTSAHSITASGIVEKTRESVRFWTLASLITFALSLVFFVGFMTAGGVFFTLSDGVALLMAGTMIPVMVGYDRLLRSDAGRSSVFAKWIGVVGMVIAAAGSIILLTSEISHEFVPGDGGLGMQFLGFSLEGVWFLLVGWMALKAGLLQRRTAAACFVAGFGFLVAVPGSIQGPDSLFVMLGAPLSFVGYLLWAVWSRRDLAGG